MRAADGYPGAASPPARSFAWLAVSALLAGGALVGWWSGRAALLDWRPLLAWSEPWRWWTAAWVHLSDWHLVANLAGLALVGVLGWRAGADRVDAAAWALAWPLTHGALLLQPSLLRYAGMSGVLHAGVVVAALCLLRQRAGGRRRLGWAIVAGVVLKLLLEEPWRGALRQAADWSFPVAAGAHLAGTCAGALCALAIRHARVTRAG